MIVLDYYDDLQKITVENIYVPSDDLLKQNVIRPNRIMEEDQKINNEFLEDKVYNRSIEIKSDDELDT